MIRKQSLLVILMGAVIDCSSPPELQAHLDLTGARTSLAISEAGLVLAVGGLGNTKQDLLLREGEVLHELPSQGGHCGQAVPLVEEGSFMIGCDDGRLARVDPGAGVRTIRDAVHNGSRLHKMVACGNSLYLLYDDPAWEAWVERSSPGSNDLSIVQEGALDFATPVGCAPLVVLDFENIVALDSDSNVVWAVPAPADPTFLEVDDQAEYLIVVGWREVSLYQIENTRLVSRLPMSSQVTAALFYNGLIWLGHEDGTIEARNTAFELASSFPAHSGRVLDLAAYNLTLVSAGVEGNAVEGQGSIRWWRL
ncbi:MAG: hypothetical protein H7A21_04255 [Spirochaetales bacterium]|nr:hypothetical protein [Spirochaetales bacterium]MCP5483978.1 hypothetical protein [Spirochaetales bacterium]